MIKSANDTIIQTALDGQLSASVRWPNSSTPAPTQGAWIGGEVINVRTSGGPLGGKKVSVTGIVEFRVYTGKNISEVPANNLINELEKAFPVGAALQSAGAGLRISANSARKGENLTAWHVRVFRVDFFGYITPGV